MKKVVSTLLVLVMILCSAAVSASAAGSLYMDADFSSDESFARDFFPEAYFTNDGCAVGYSDARAFQTVGNWPAYDTSFDVTFSEDELYTGTENRSLSFIYMNNNMPYLGLSEDTYSISVCFDATDDSVSLIAGGWTLAADSNILAGPVDFTIDDDKEYHFGVSVAEGHIRVFEESTLLIDYVDTENKYYIGYSYEEVEPSILVWWNTGNCMTFSDVKVSSPEYLYPATPVADNTEATTTPAATTTAISVVEKTDDSGNVVTDADGNKVTDTVVITDAPADTNTGAVQGGSSTNTGDNAFVVVAAMVASLGCALIIRKVNA